IEATATGWIDIVMTGDGIDPYLELLDSNCSLVDSGPVSLSGQSTVMTGTVPGNVLYVFLSSMESLDTGDYDLGISVWGF
ncbi:MAG: hypothetical protein VX498_00725, partial [Myxococcota bacterium]|nr:hypothetical protein [Myxococcota bacterium]